MCVATPFAHPLCLNPANPAGDLRESCRCTRSVREFTVPESQREFPILRTRACIVLACIRRSSARVPGSRIQGASARLSPCSSATVEPVFPTPRRQACVAVCESACYPALSTHPQASEVGVRTGGHPVARWASRHR